jgi:hypothetical protein
MQTLVWFVRTLRWCDGSKRDSRILLRLLTTVAKEYNMFAHLFDATELLGFAGIVKLAQACNNDARVQGVQQFCVKTQIAATWHSNNENSMLIGSSVAADPLC